MHDQGRGRMARRKVTGRTKGNANSTAQRVEYADLEPSAFASMLGGLIQANVEARPERRRDLEGLKAKVGIWVTDIDEGVTLDFKQGALTVHNGLRPRRDITIRADAETVMGLSNLRIGLLGLPIYHDSIGRGIAVKLMRRKLRIDGLVGNLATLNTVTRIFSVR